jgi:hypothetical protein
VTQITCSLRQPFQLLAHNVGCLTSDAGVHFIENQALAAPIKGSDGFNANIIRDFATRGDPHQGLQVFPGLGLREFNLIDPVVVSRRGLTIVLAGIRSASTNAT